MKLIQMVAWGLMFTMFEPLLLAQINYYPTQLKLTRGIGLNSSVPVFNTRFTNENGLYVYPGSYVYNIDQLFGLGELTSMDWFSYEGVLKITEPDNEAPVLSIASDKITWEAGVPFEVDKATATDNSDGDVTSNIKVDTFVNVAIPGEMYHVTYTVQDAAGNVATKQVFVTVVDTRSPEIKLNVDSRLIWEQGVPFEAPTATATDLLDGDVTANIKVDSFVNVAIPGEMYHVTYTVQDAAGNIATKQIFVSVVDRTTPDTEAPVITVASEKVTWEAGVPFEVAKATATDNFDGDVTANIKVDTFVNVAIPGEMYHVTYTVEDAVGNVARKQVFVTVADTRSPEISLSVDSTLIWDQGVPFKAPTATATDLLDGDVTANIKVDTFVNVAIPGEMYHVTYTVQDAAGNVATKQIFVSVVDSDPKSAIGINYYSLHDNEFTIYYEGTLESAESIDGPWTIVVDASSPYIISSLDRMRFYRVICCP